MNTANPTKIEKPKQPLACVSFPTKAERARAYAQSKRRLGARKFSLYVRNLIAADAD